MEAAPPEKVDGRKERGMRRRHGVLAAARELFIENGYRGTTLEAIIARAGGSRLTIYRAFGGKSGLLSAIISEESAELIASVASPMALALAPRDALMQFGVKLVGVWRTSEGQAVNRALVSEGLDVPELLDGWYKSCFEPSVAALSRYFRAQVEAGHLVDIEPVLAARQFIYLLAGEMSLPIMSGTWKWQSAKTHVQRCVDVVVRAYEVR